MPALCCRKAARRPASGLLPGRPGRGLPSGGGPLTCRRTTPLCCDGMPPGLRPTGGLLRSLPARLPTVQGEWCGCRRLGSVARDVCCRGPFAPAGVRAPAVGGPVGDCRLSKGR
ncbi:hypothetical protein GCM10010271_54620 [Streptomyces kurssanovii]|nr:hypothetical protein GCM10010271_54620 [Streptomyces kurssanovii]